MRNKEYLVAIRPDADVLALETMYFSDEVRSPVKELPNLPGAGVATDQELKMAHLLIDSMEGEWEPERYHDTHRQKIEALIEQKSQGMTIAVAKAPPATKVVDLMAALSASIERTGSGQTKTKPTTRPKTASGKAPLKRAPAKITAAKKTAKAPAAKAVRRKAS